VGGREENFEFITFSNYEIEEHSYLIEEGKIMTQTIH
jgi:hypothetical protein